MKKKLAIILSLMLLLTPVYASSLSNKKDQLKDTKQNIEQTKQALEKTKVQKEGIKQEIIQVDQQIINLEDKMLQLEEQLSEKKEQLQKSEEALALAMIQKEDQYEATKKRMVQMYKNQNTGYIEVVFSSDNFLEAINRLEYIKRISKQDNKLIELYQEQVDTIEQHKAVVEEEKRQLDLIQKEQLAKKGELNLARTKKNQAMTDLAGQEEKLQAQIKEMQQISKNLEAEIKRLTQQSTIKYTGGAFLWPVPGNYRISSEYNPRTNPISGKYEFHSGIDIPAPYGTQVVAAADGVVINSGWINGYGNTVMVNHGSGLVTLYAHNSSLAVSVGQTVKRGQKVAGIGSTGYSTGNHCHFEVRLNGAHTNPWNYIKK